MRRPLLTTLMAAVVAASATAQTVVRDVGDPNPLESKIQTASVLYPGWFPNPSGHDTYGTVIVVSGDFQRSYVRIVGEQLAVQNAIPDVKRLLDDIGFPDAVIHVTKEWSIEALDIDLSRYIHSSLGSSAISIPIGQIVSRLQRTGLSKPIGVAIDHVEHSSSVSYQGRNLDRMLAVSGANMPLNATVDFASERHWYGLLFLMVMLIAFAAFVSSVFYWSLLPRSKWPRWMRTAPPRRAPPQLPWGLPAGYYFPLYITFQAVLIMSANFASRDMPNWYPAAAVPSLGPAICVAAALILVCLIIRGLRGPLHPR